MRKLLRNKWAVMLLGGSVLLQAPGCVEAAAVVTAASSLLTAGGVFYLITRILD